MIFMIKRCIFKIQRAVDWEDVNARIAALKISSLEKNVLYALTAPWESLIEELGQIEFKSIKDLQKPLLKHGVPINCEQ